jgi:hypothetical protein
MCFIIFILREKKKDWGIKETWRVGGEILMRYHSRIVSEILNIFRIAASYQYRIKYLSFIKDE